MRVTIRRENDWQQNQYCILDFKGKFQLDVEDHEKSLVHLGCLEKVGEKQYRLEIGLMDLIGNEAPMKEMLAYTEIEEGEDHNERVVKIKGIISKRITFEKRPIPIMERSASQITKARNSVSHAMNKMFRKESST